MDAGVLAGTRFDKAIAPETDYRIGTIALLTLSANDADMAGDQARTHLMVTGNDDTGKGIFSLRALLGSGTASDDGKNFVAEAVKKIEKVQADVTALLALDTTPPGLEGILDGQWTKLEAALDTIVGADSAAETGATSAVPTRADGRAGALQG